MKKILLNLLILITLFSCTGCKKKNDNSDATKLSFKNASTYEYLKSLEGNKIVIRGYMATSSPVDGSFIFLMNLPYQSCPFCVPNTSELSNTIEAYPKKGHKFSYTSSAIEVVGTLEVAKNISTPFVDEYGYEFNFKLINAEYHILKDEELSDNIKIYQQLSNSNIVSDLYSMYNYVNFCCDWPTYYVDSYTNEKGQLVPGYYLYDSDAKQLIENDGAQYNYGYKDDYFTSLISRLQKVSKTDFIDIIDNIQKAETLARYAVSELDKGNYSFKTQSIERFGTIDRIYTMNDTTLVQQYNNLYYTFSDWLSSFEM